MIDIDGYSCSGRRYGDAQSGPPQAGLKVTFSTRSGVGPWVYRGTALTDAQGRASTSVTPTSAGQFQVRAEVTGTNAYASSVGTSGAVEVTRRG